MEVFSIELMNHSPLSKDTEFLPKWTSVIPTKEKQARLMLSVLVNVLAFLWQTGGYHQLMVALMYGSISRMEMEDICNELFCSFDKDQGKYDELLDVTQFYKDGTWSVRIRFAVYRDVMAAWFRVRLKGLGKLGETEAPANAKVYGGICTWNELLGSDCRSVIFGKRKEKSVELSSGECVPLSRGIVALPTGIKPSYIVFLLYRAIPGDDGIGKGVLLCSQQIKFKPTPRLNLTIRNEQVELEVGIFQTGFPRSEC